MTTKIVTLADLAEIVEEARSRGHHPASVPISINGHTVSSVELIAAEIVEVNSSINSRVVQRGTEADGVAVVFSRATFLPGGILFNVRL